MATVGNKLPTPTTTKLNRKGRKAATSKKPQVRVNKQSGRIFENIIFKYLTEYLKDREIEGMVYKLPDGLRSWEQPIDILIDSAEFGYVGIEAKSIDDSKLKNDKIYLKNLSRKNATHGHQFRKEHIFLKATGRSGIVAFNFTGRNIIVLVPHQWIYDEIERGTVYLTVPDIIANGFDIRDTKGSLKLFIKRKCQTI